MSLLLRVKDLEVSYGAVPAVKRVALEVPAGEIRAILGANGAGKSSTIKAILGLVKARGTIELEGRPIHGVPTHRIHQLGVAWVPEGRQLFSTLTVHENLEMGAFARGDGPRFASRVDEMFTLFPRLRERRGQLAGSLSGGEQQMLAIARALISEPRLLIMDEPSLGLAPLIIEEVYRFLATLRTEGLTLVLVEESAARALQFADRALVMKNGRTLLEGSAEEVRGNPRLAEAFLGEISEATL